MGSFIHHLDLSAKGNSEMRPYPRLNLTLEDRVRLFVDSGVSKRDKSSLSLRGLDFQNRDYLDPDQLPAQDLATSMTSSKSSHS